METPFSRAWDTIMRYPALALVPIAWDLLPAGLLWLLGYGTPAGQAGPGRAFRIKFLLPSALPSGTELLGNTASVQFGAGGIPAGPILISLLLALVAALVTAGFLHLLVGALRGEAPSWDRFTDGVNRFGPRMLVWDLIVFAAVITAGLLAVLIGPAAIVLLLIGFLLALFLVLVPFLIVVEDLSVGDAVSRASGRFVEHFGGLVVIALASVILSAVVSITLSALGLSYLVLAAPIWGFLGTVFTLAVVSVLIPPWATA